MLVTACGDIALHGACRWRSEQARAVAVAMDLDDAVGGELLDGVTGFRAILAHLRVKSDHSGEIGIRERLDVTCGGVRDDLCAASD